MCPGWLVFSTSKKIACRVVGRRRSGTGGGTRVAKTGSGAPSANRSPPPPGGGGHGRPLAAKGVELALERAVAPAKLAQLSAEPLAFLLPRLERAPQAIALIDQRWDHVAELILAFR